MPESVCEFKHTCAMMHRWRAEDNFRDSVLSIPLVFEAGSLLFPHVVCVRPAGLRASGQFPSCHRSAGLQMLTVTAGCFAWALEIHLRLVLMSPLLLPTETSCWACFWCFESASHISTGTHYVA